MEMLSSTTALVLVNGYPSREFSMFRGLRQGGLLSPFLFVLVMEGLHVALSRAQMDNVGVLPLVTWTCLIFSMLMMLF